MTFPEGRTAAEVPTAVHVRPSEVPEVRRGPLGNAQAYEWWKYQSPNQKNDDWNDNTYLDVAVPAGVSRSRIQDALAALVERHEALRTTFQFDDGYPVQVVHAPYVPSMVEHHDRDAESARLFTARIWYHDFSLDQEFPMLVGLIVEDDTPVRLVMSFPHLLSDGTSLVILDTELRQRLSDTAPEKEARVPGQQLDAAIEEATHQGKAGDAAVRYWARVLSARPNRMFVGPPDEEISTTSLWWISPTAPAVFERTAAQLQTTIPVLYGAAIHLALHLVAGGTVSVLKNHFTGRAGVAWPTVGCFSRQLLTLLDLADRPSLQKVVARTASATLLAQARGGLNHLPFRELEAREERRRGIVFADGVVLNFNPGVGTGEFEHLKPREPVEPGRATLYCTEPLRNFEGFDAYISASWWPDVAEVYGTFNDNSFSFAQTQAILEFPERLYEHFLQYGDVSYDGFAELMRLPERTAEGVWAPASRVHLPAATEQLLQSHPAVISARVVQDTERIVGYVCVGSAVVTPREVAEFVRAGLRPWISAVCPDQIVVCQGEPPDPTDADGWARMPRVPDGTGAGDRLSAAVGSGRALTAAVCEVNKLADIDPAASYVESGGRMALVPAVLRHLERQGYGGLVADDFLRPVCLETLAAALSNLS